MPRGAAEEAREGDLMKRINKGEALRGLEDDERTAEIRKEIEERANGLFLLRIEDEASFLSLIFEERPGTRILTPGIGRPRTLLDVAERIRDHKHTFDNLARNHQCSLNDINPEFFAKCAAIEANFDFKRFGRLILVHANNDERKQTPHGSFYIHDGNHRALILAKKVVVDGERFPGIECLLIVPRPREVIR
jgi:hypothetical protein